MSDIIQKINCIYHNDRTPSMVIYKSGFFKCYGCGKQGWLKPDELLAYESRLTPSGKYIPESKKVIDETKFGYYHDSFFWTNFLKERHIDQFTAAQYQLKYAHKELLIPLYNEKGYRVGSQVRKKSGSPKYVTYPQPYNCGKPGCLVIHPPAYPKYAVVSADYPVTKDNALLTPELWIVESVLDALSLQRFSTIPALVLLGTNVDSSVWNVIDEYDPDMVWIYFDRDAVDKANLVGDKVSLWGWDVGIIVTENKPYQVSEEWLTYLMKQERDG